MNIRQTQIQDINSVMDVFVQAKKFIKSQGFDQWQEEDYPSIDIIENDITTNSSYVLCDEDKILGYMCLYFGNEPTYNKIYQGKWESTFEYAVIHRLALSDECRGNNVSKIFFDFAEKKCIENNIRSLRIDTHTQNEVMKHILKKRKYKNCGIVKLENNEDRIAFEKLIIPFLVGDKVQMRKKHPCGSDIFEIKRVGMDFRLECEGCNNQIWLSRSDMEKRLKKRI